jgi:NADH dehydrogenase FAD-containing subunit
VAKGLDETADVTLIEPKDAFVHNVAALRALVAPDWLPRIFLPYAGLLTHGPVVRDRAAKVGTEKVVLASGDEIGADFIVLATGSRYPFPAKSEVDDTATAHGRVRAAHAALLGARRVLLVGAGPVGVELAGEIAAAWPDRHVILVDMAEDVLGPRYSPELRAELRRQLAEAGVEVLLGTSLDALPAVAPGEAADIRVRTTSGAEITADVWFRCFGVDPVSDYLGEDLVSARRPDGSVEVNEYLQVGPHQHVFALGDVSTADAKLAGLASRQAQVVVANATALMTGEGDLTPYESIGPAIAVPIGPEGGAGQLPGQEGIVGPDVISDLKGRDMMVDRFAEMLGVNERPT